MIQVLYSKIPFACATPIFMCACILCLVMPVFAGNQLGDRLGKKDSPYKNTRLLSFTGHFGRTLTNVEFPEKLKIASVGEISISWQTRGKRAWHPSYHYPIIGASLLIGDQGNHAILGQFISAMGIIAFQKAGKKGWFREYRGGIGYAGFNRPHHVINNPDNLLIGTRVTNATFNSYSIGKALSNQTSLMAGLSWLHFSNGQFGTPNLGSNIFTLSLCARYNASGQAGQRQSFPEKTEKQALQYFIRLGLGLHEFASTHSLAGGPLFPIYSSSVYIAQPKRTYRLLHFGFHLHYYVSYHDFILRQETFPDHEKLKSMNLVAFVGKEWLMGHFSIMAEAGINLYDPFRQVTIGIPFKEQSFLKKLSSISANKFGTNYYLFDPVEHTGGNVYLGLYIKAHFTQADFGEMALGYRF